ncbi:MAG: aromatic ring-hydroxylating dioxygenase subunit alpha [Gammaproteobacteria bacterium]|nr:aromatic ring-hydroxylating dioxygenase subunit alpha [Gammaproteobacteria bacterium]
MPQTRYEPAAFSGYHLTAPGKPDRELTEVGPGTLCGEYLRRYWHPVCLADELGARPRLIRVLGEDLVLFRDRGGRLGLVHKKCPHRRASLEFGRCEARGIRCCYHGWLFDIDGAILDIPGEPADSPSAQKVMQSTRLGAYPTHEYKGLIFAYLGPPEARPRFPVYDTFELPDTVMSPYEVRFNCNWLQVLDAIADPAHTAFLHHAQFSEGFGALGEIRFYERHKTRFLGTATRRVGGNVWVRVNELILPNFTQAGAAFAVDGRAPAYFGRSAFTRWVVPVDDEHCVARAWGNFGPRADPPEWNTPEGLQRIEQGEPVERSYAQRQLSPGDLEAVEGMGAIADHDNEHLVSSDRGVALYRRRLRRLCRDLADGHAPPQPADLAPGIIPTYGSDTVIQSPRGDGDGDGNGDGGGGGNGDGNDGDGGGDGDGNGDIDSAQLNRINDQVMEVLFSADDLQGDARDRFVIDKLRQLSR